MRQLLRVVVVLSLLATAVVLAQAAALPTLDTGSRCTNNRA